MHYLEPVYGSLRKHRSVWSLGATLLLLLCAAGCGSNKGADTSSTPSAVHGPQNYFAPYVAATTNGGAVTALTGPNLYSIDDAGDSFSQSIFQLLTSVSGPQVINVGSTTTGQRGLLNLAIATNYTVSGAVYVPTNFTPPKPGSFAVELAGQAGGLVQLAGQPVAPLVAATECPNLKTAQTWQFISIPGGLISPGAPQVAGSWDPATEAAYGSVDISTNGSNVSFANIRQYTLPSAGGAGTPAQQPTSPVAGLCGPTVLGNTISAPGQVVVQNPGLSNGTPPQATIGIGPSGLLVEDNGVVTVGAAAGQYENLLGAGTGAVGLPEPSSALDPTAVAAAQYLGFVYGAGVYSGNSSQPASDWSSHLASFGFSSRPSTCAAMNASGVALIYGGDFTKDNPSASSNGFGNCDLAIDLGSQDPSNNGRFPKATVWIGASYAANTTGKTYSFQAVAIAGQLNGKYAIFLLGVDSVEPWTIYLLQSN